MNIEFTLTLIIYLWEILYYPVFLQIAELKAKRDQNQDQEKQMKTRIEHLEKTVKHQQQELKKRASQVSEFERVRKPFNDYFFVKIEPASQVFLWLWVGRGGSRFLPAAQKLGRALAPSFARPKSGKSLRLCIKPYRKNPCCAFQNEETVRISSARESMRCLQVMFHQQPQKLKLSQATKSLA